MTIQEEYETLTNKQRNKKQRIFLDNLYEEYKIDNIVENRLLFLKEMTGFTNFHQHGGVQTLATELFALESCMIMDYLPNDGMGEDKK